jgi:hypothetical protein
MNVGANSQCDSSLYGPFSLCIRIPRFIEITLT